MEMMTNNITNNISGNGMDLFTLINGEDSIQKMAEGIQMLFANQAYTKRKAADLKAVKAFKESALYKAVTELENRQYRARKNKAKNFWGKYKNRAERNALTEEVRELFEKNCEGIPYYSRPDNAYDLKQAFISGISAKVYEEFDSYSTLSYGTIYAILLTIPKLETKSFNDILTEVTKYVSK